MSGLVKSREVFNIQQERLALPKYRIVLIPVLLSRRSFLDKLISCGVIGANPHGLQYLQSAGCLVYARDSQSGRNGHL